MTKILLIKDHARLSEIYDLYAKIARVTAVGTWPALFNTARHKVLIKHRQKIIDHFKWKVRKITGQRMYCVVTIEHIGDAIIWNVEGDNKE